MPDIEVCHIRVTGFQQINWSLEIRHHGIAGRRQSELTDRWFIDPEPHYPTTNKNQKDSCNHCVAWPLWTELGTALDHCGSVLSWLSGRRCSPAKDCRVSNCFPCDHRILEMLTRPGRWRIPGGYFNTIARPTGRMHWRLSSWFILFLISTTTRMVKLIYWIIVKFHGLSC